MSSINVAELIQLLASAGASVAGSVASDQELALRVSALRSQAADTNFRAVEDFKVKCSNWLLSAGNDAWRAQNPPPVPPHKIVIDDQGRSSWTDFPDLKPPVYVPTIAPPSAGNPFPSAAGIPSMTDLGRAILTLQGTLNNIATVLAEVAKKVLQ